MRFVFSRLFFILLALGLVPLSVSWRLPFLRTAVIVFDVALVVLAVVDYLLSRRLPGTICIPRGFERRLAIGDPSEVKIVVESGGECRHCLLLKDEYPAAMRLEDSREAEQYREAQESATFSYFLTPTRRGRYEFGNTAIRFRSR